MSFLMPLNTVSLPVTAALTGAAKVHTPTALELQSFSGVLRGLLSGSIGVDLRDDDTDDLIAQLSWSPGGGKVVETISPSYQLAADKWIRFDVTGLPVTASGLYVTVWALGN
jgi:surface antigen